MTSGKAAAEKSRPSVEEAIVQVTEAQTLAVDVASAADPTAKAKKQAEATEAMKKALNTLGAAFQPPDEGHPVWTAIGIACGLLVFIVLLGLMYLGWKKLNPGAPQGTEANNDALFRSQLARSVTFGALTFIVVAAAIILLAAGINAAIRPDKENTTLFFDISKWVLGVILPVVAAWVGTVMAFYFGKENFEAASKSVRDMAKAMTSQDKLAATPVRVLGTAKEAMIILPLTTSDGAEAAKTKLDVVENAFTKGGFTYERLPVLFSTGAPYILLHRSALNDFLRQMIKKDKTKDAKDYTLADLFAGDGTPWVPANSFVAVGPEATAAQAKEKMEKVKGCADVFVTVDGTAQGGVSRWLTNVDLLKAAEV